MGTWAHGITRETKAGTVFVMVAMASGVRYRKTLGLISEEAALEQWRIFKRAPKAFKSDREKDLAEKAQACYLTAGEISRFVAYLEDEGRHPDYIAGVSKYLSEWIPVFKQQNIKTIDIGILDRALEKWAAKRSKRRNGTGAAAYRIKALKSWVKYLKTARGGRRMTEADDPFKVMKVPSAGERKEKAYSIARLAQTYSDIKVWSHAKSAKYKRSPDPETIQAVRDVFQLGARTGMHLSEINRLAAGDATVRVLGPEYGQIAGTVRFKHKSGMWHVVSVDAQALKAAQRLVMRGSAPGRGYLRKVLQRARQVDVDVLNCGWLRHSFATISKGHGIPILPLDRGVPLELIADVLGHKSLKMLKEHYNWNDVPLMISIPSLILHNVDDPA